MGVSLTEDDHRWVGNQRVVTATATFDASYTNGGEAIAPTDVDLNTIESVSIDSGTTSGGNPVEYDRTSGVLVVYDSTHSELADGSAAVDGQTVTLTIRGRS